MSAEASAKRILVFGWGAAAERVLREVAECRSRGAALKVFCVSHLSQASDCDLSDVCASLEFECTLTDSDSEMLEAASGFAPDLIMSASYRKKLRPEVLALCADSINFHPSLLPKHRGCMSGFWAIFEGDAETGVTCHRMVERFDEGRILHQERLPVSPEDTSFFVTKSRHQPKLSCDTCSMLLVTLRFTIYKKILPVTAACARRVLEIYFASGLPEGEEQTGEGSYHFRRLPFDGVIQAEWTHEQVERFIRAMHFPPFDGAGVCFEGKDGGQRVLVESLDHYLRLKREAAAAGGAA
mmetsp:Transcript_15228/g.53490  ORF Transcript_15228/g.53490 Transcript_15228/m.53490 type:complete len:297 (-) Transcript_15228:197-1087(-)